MCAQVCVPVYLSSPSKPLVASTTCLGDYTPTLFGIKAAGANLAPALFLGLRGGLEPGNLPTTHGQARLSGGHQSYTA